MLKIKKRNMELNKKMEKKISRKQKAGIIATVLLIGTLVGFSSVSLANPPQPPEQGFKLFRNNCTVSLNATDGIGGSGVRFTSIAVYYKLNDADAWTTLLAPTNYTGSIRYAIAGLYQVHYFSVDRCGNIEVEKFKTFRIVIDTTPPVTTITLTGQEISIT